MYSYSCSVNNGLKALSDEEYIKAMQSINTAIQNPYFFSCFMGLIVLLPLSAWQAYTQPYFYVWLGATLLYCIGVFGVTVFGNVPLNDQLAAFDTAKASVNEISAMRTAFESAWNSYHFIRTVAAILSFGLALVALFRVK